MGAGIRSSQKRDRLQDDQLVPTPGGTDWQQKTSFYSQHAHGKFFGFPNGIGNDEFEFTDTNLSVSGIFFNHDFSKTGGPAPDGSECPKKYWEMSGSSWSYIAKDNQGASAEFEYEPINDRELFAITIPYTMLDNYGYDWQLVGEWDNGECKTHSSFDGEHGAKFNMTGSISYFGTPPVPGLSIIPLYTDSTIIGYTIIVDNTNAGYGSDGGFYVSIDKCTATLKPFSKITGVKKTEPMQQQFILSQNYPNPFNPTTVINYQLPVICLVTLKIYDLLGREVRTLVANRQKAGNYSVTFDAKNLPSGVYFYFLHADTFTQTKKLMILK